MSLKNWLFGSDEPGMEKPNAPMPCPPAASAKPDQPADTSGTVKKQESQTDRGEAKPTEPVPPLKDNPVPLASEDVEHTQILTREQIRAMSDEDREKSKPIKFVPPPKSGVEKGTKETETHSRSQSGSDLKPEEQSTPKPQGTIAAATWKIEAVNEPWAPAEVAKAFPSLAAQVYSDHEAVERVLPGWRLIGGSRRGRKQAHDARFREDAMYFGVSAEITVLSVADGAGSCRLSRIGSHIAVRETVDHALSSAGSIPPEDRKDSSKLEAALKKILTDSVKTARKRVIEVAEKSGLNPKEFRATLLTVILWRDGDTELLLSNQVGDGAIAVIKSDQSILKLGESDSGTFSGEVSCFLTDTEGDAKAEIVRSIPDAHDVEALFLCSDGIEDPFYPIDKKAADIFRQWHTGVTEALDGFKSQPTQEAVFHEEAAAGALARWLEFEKRGENDDRTILVLHRLPVRMKF